MGEASGSIPETEVNSIVSDADHPLAGKRGLVLEDEFLIALDLEELLQGAGAEIVSVSRIDQALDTLRDGGHFDFAVLDRHLGSTTSAGVGAACADRKIPFLYLTGSRGSGRSEQPGPGAPVVEKPYRPDVLIKAIRGLLDGR